ncbi:MAG: hypothetical protein FD161_2756 [Limisphaerales bacterium]|nr:MAG: hypothetical protein FD161_2756 [Limisphaerales bacterium]KAG0508254.1 MAG: hypothetical protein E1N63_2507 [Limisphaerales bacterium]TXT49569.1 MAG: hypothetical protein FD140_2895 [Limisphaerales bacterium]
MMVSDQDTLDVMLVGKRLTVSEMDNGHSLAYRSLWGGFMLAVGGFVLWAFLGQGGPSFKVETTLSERLIGGSMVALLVVAMGIIPCCWGLGTLFVRDRLVFDAGRGCVEVHKTVFEQTVRRREYPLKDFDEIAVGQRRLGGALTSRTVFVVESRSVRRSLDVAGCLTQQQAEDLATQIAQHTGLAHVSKCASVHT